MLVFLVIKIISSLFEEDFYGSQIVGFLFIITFYCSISYFVLRHIRRRAGYRQILIVTSSHMVVIDKSYAYRETRKVNLGDVEHMYIIGTEPYAKIESDDDRRFRLKYAHTHDTIMIKAGTNSISLAANLPSWDGDDIIESVEKFIGRKLVPEQSEEPIDINELYSRKNLG